MAPEGASAERGLPWGGSPRRPAQRLPHCVLAGSLAERDRIGEALTVGEPLTLGRGGPLADDPARRAVFARIRPGGEAPCRPVCNARIGRGHLLLDPEGSGVRLRPLARAEVRVSGRATTDDVATDGDVVELHNAAVFLVVSRSLAPPTLRAAEPPRFAFGAPDAFGIVGESEAVWALREVLAFAAGTDPHTLLLGDSGVGKELAARTIHRPSARAP